MQKVKRPRRGIYEKEKILFEDSNRFSNTSLTLLLKKAGYTVESVSGINTAFLKFYISYQNEKDIKLFIKNIHEFYINELHFLKQVVQNHFSIPILVLIDPNPNEHIIELVEKSGIDYIEKPFEIDMLLNKVENIFLNKVCEHI